MANYREALTRDPLFWTSVSNTFYFIGVSVPLGIVVAFALALMLNAKIRGTGAYRTIYYLPSVVPTVAAVIVWIFIFETRRGILNFGLELLGLPAIRWLSDPNWAMPALIIMSLWSIGATMIIFLAGLQGIPQELYEAAEVDGANAAATAVAHHRALDDADHLLQPDHESGGRVPGLQQRLHHDRRRTQQRHACSTCCISTTTPSATSAWAMPRRWP